MKYLKVWTDFEKVVAPLSWDEIGHLFVYMLHYAGTGEEPQKFSGNEAFLWAVAKRDIDLMAEKDEKLRQNGAKGGLAKSRNKQMLANGSNGYQTLANVSKGCQDEPVSWFATDTEANVSLKRIERKEKEKKKSKYSFLDTGEIFDTQDDHNRVIDAAEDAGFKMSNDVREKLISLYADYGLQKVLDGINTCVEYGATNLAYLKAVLSGKPKPGKDYSQRDYSGEQQAAIDRMMGGMDIEA